MALAELDTTTIKSRPGARLTDTQAQEIAPELFEIEKRDGLIKPQAVVDAARDPASPLHGLFEWDDAAAAKKQRLATARQIIRSVTFRVQSLGPRINDYTAAFVNVREGGEEDDDQVTTPQHQGYASVVRVLGEDKLRAQMLETAARQLEAWIRRFETLNALDKAMTTARDLLAQVKAA
jgi:hypothetical protein